MWCVVTATTARIQGVPYPQSQLHSHLELMQVPPCSGSHVSVPLCVCVRCTWLWVCGGGGECWVWVQKRWMSALGGTRVHTHARVWVCRRVCTHSPVSDVGFFGVVKWGFIEMHDCEQAHRIINLHIQFSEDAAGPAQIPWLSDSSIHPRGFNECLLSAKSCVRHCKKGKK